MDKYPDVDCKRCGKRFETQVRVDPQIYALFPKLTIGVNTFTCPQCTATAEYSEDDFLYTTAQARELKEFGKTVAAFFENGVHNILLHTVIVPGARTDEGRLIEAVALPLFDIIDCRKMTPARSSNFSR
jgi:hypothetical protein